MKRIIALCSSFIFLLTVLTGCEHEKNLNNSLKESNLESKEVAESEKELFDTYEFKCLSCFDILEVSFWLEKGGKYYIYINEWQEHRQLEGLEQYSKYHVQIEQTSTVIAESVCTIAAYIQSGKSDTEIITFHFNKNSNAPLVYKSKLETMIHDEPNYYMINLYNENYGSFFYIPSHYVSEDKSQYWPIIRYETADGGKTWNKVKVLDLVAGIHECPTVVKFISKEVGIVSYRYWGINDLRNRTYLTIDGGLNWNLISNLTYPFDLDRVRYTEVYDLSKKNEEFLLTVQVHSDSVSYIYFKSSDCVNWELYEQ